MPQESYKHYLEYLQKHTGKLSLYKKFLIAIVGIGFVSTGTVSALYYQYQKEEPLRAENRYLEQVATTYNTSKDSLDEVLQTFKVAGVKAQAVDNLKEASGQAQGFTVSLDDLERTLSKIESTKKNMLFLKGNIAKSDIPEKFSSFNRQVQGYYDESIKLLDSLYAKYSFAKDILTASGPEFYLPAFTNEVLWKRAQKQELLAHYKKSKDEVSGTLANLAALTVPEQYKEYHKLQIAYLEQYVLLSQNIIAALELPDDTNPEAPTQVEKAYQLLIGARRQNETLSTKISEEKLKALSEKGNYADFALINLTEVSIDNKIAQIYTEQPEPKSSQITTIIGETIEPFISKIIDSIKQKF